MIDLEYEDDESTVLDDCEEILEDASNDGLDVNDICNSSGFFKKQNTQTFIKACAENFNMRCITEVTKAVNLKLLEERLEAIVNDHPDEDSNYWHELSRRIIIAYYIGTARNPKEKVLITIFFRHK
jgi:nitrogenase subunit NifH